MEKVSEEQYNMTATLDDVRMVAPALERYTQGALADLWKRPGLSARDRSLITVSVLIARNPNVFSAVPVAKDVFEKRPE